MTETVRRVRQDSLLIHRRDAAEERMWLEPGTRVGALIRRIGREDETVEKVIYEVPPPHALGLVPADVWVRRGNDFAPREYVSGRLQVEVDADALAEVCGSHHVARVIAFGSVLTDYFDPYSSDVDVAVEFESGRKPGLFGLMDLGDDLSERVFDRRAVDVLTIESAKRSRLIREDLDGSLVLYERSG